MENAQVPPVKGGAQAEHLVRIAAFDYVRGLAAIFMIVPHLILMFGTDSAFRSVIGRIMHDVIGTAPAAPVFMLLMGVFLVYPAEKPVPRMMSRGVRIFLLGVVLNVARSLAPILLAFAVRPQMVQPILDMFHLSLAGIVAKVLRTLDILQFAGVTFMLVAILQRFVRNSYIWAAAGAVVVIVAPHLWGAGQDWGFWYSLVQPLWGSELSPAVARDTAFPVFPWLVYPIAGIIIGKAMGAGRDEAWLFNRMLAAGFMLFIGGGAYVVLGSTETLGDYYRMYPAGTALVLGFALLWTCLFMWFSRRGLFQNGLSKLVYWSKNLTLLYCVQWILIGFSMLLFGYKNFEQSWICAALIPVYVFLTYRVTRRLKKVGWFMRGFRWFLD